MSERQYRELRGKKEDFATYAIILFGLGVFLTFGLLIPYPNKTTTHTFMLAGLSTASLCASIYFHFHSLKIKRLLEEHEDFS